MKSNAIRWFEIYVQDMERAKKFYEKVFNHRLGHIANQELEMWSFPMSPNASGCGGALVKMQGVYSGGNSTIVYFASDDCSVEEKRVESAGGKIMRPKTSIGEYGFISLVYDTEGNVIGIHSMK